MQTINGYLTFGGNCAEAMNFYQTILGGDLQLQTVGNSPLAEKMPEKMQNAILHATLTTKGFVLMASDMAPQKGIVKGNAISLIIDCKSENEIKTLHKKLSTDGMIDHEIENTFWDSLLGDVTDKFGNHWLLHYNNAKDKNENSSAN